MGPALGWEWKEEIGGCRCDEVGEIEGTLVQQEGWSVCREAAAWVMLVAAMLMKLHPHLSTSHPL